MRREDGILEMKFHTNGGPLHWSLLPHRELEQAFLAAGRDKDNELVILTGAGDQFSGPGSGRKATHIRASLSYLAGIRHPGRST